MPRAHLNKILIIQTAFIGDVILATSLIEKLHEHFPKAEIHFLLRKGNESLLSDHPKLAELIVWNKKEGKVLNLFKLIKQVRASKFDLVINLQRFLSSGMISVFSGAKELRGFGKNPLSVFFSKRYSHQIGEQKNAPHEIERNQQLISDLTDSEAALPKLYPPELSFPLPEKYVTMSPASVWFTKMLPVEKWLELIQHLPKGLKIFLLGGPMDKSVCEEIKSLCDVNREVEIMAGKLSLLESASLMKRAQMKYVNDSAPLHLASATNEPVTAFFCSTIPTFGFGPL